MHEVKQGASLWINKNYLANGRFSWQEGFGVFSYGQSQIPIIGSYIKKQQKHHEKRTFIEEYLQFLKLFDVDFDSSTYTNPLNK